MPRPLFKKPTCIVIDDRDGNLLGASIARDGQWRFPYSDEIPEKFKSCIIEFEDRRFYSHWGVDPKGIARAISQNIRNKRIVSGGSTLTMQVIRMAREKESRNVWNKLIESIMASRMEWTYSKDEIMAYYASNAPFGGNVVGLEAAAWRYYAKKPSLLSWGEAATLAVLPNSPALIHPGRNRNALKDKRNRLLSRLLEHGEIDSITCELAMEEPLPDKPHPLPQLAPHLLHRVAYQLYYNKNKTIQKTTTTINRFYQNQSLEILKRHQERLSANAIHNACILIIDVETGEVLAYQGNMPNIKEEHSPAVDIVRAPRSTGSILKPILYASMIHEGSLLPQQLISDIPTQMGNYRPLNYYETYDGAVKADRAIIRSLNVPTIRMLQEYSVEKFKLQLQKLGMTTLNRPADDYGLTLIVGGAEGSLFDITNMYVNMARTLNHFYDYNGKYDKNDIRKANFIINNKKNKKSLQKEAPLLSAASIYETFKVMQFLERPSGENNWETFASDKRIAWKTGTSFGFRDAWAVGVTPKYAVGVWVGNADGEGRPGLVGVKAAAPILFDVFDFLPTGDWFSPPYDEMKTLEICSQSGFLAGDYCEKDSSLLPQNGIRAKVCPFHQLIQLDKEGKRVNAECYSPVEMQQKEWFVLPPLEEYFYQSKNPSYQKLPPFRQGCKDLNNTKNAPMELIYPKYAAKIFVPIDYDGKLNPSIFKATHRDEKATIHWHLNHEYIGSTEVFHEIEMAPPKGKHIITLVDHNGFEIEQEFEIMNKDDSD